MSRQGRAFHGPLSNHLAQLWARLLVAGGWACRQSSGSTPQAPACWVHGGSQNLVLTLSCLPASHCAAFEVSQQPPFPTPWIHITHETITDRLVLVPPSLSYTVN